MLYLFFCFVFCFVFFACEIKSSHSSNNNKRNIRAKADIFQEIEATSIVGGGLHAFDEYAKGEHEKLQILAYRSPNGHFSFRGTPITYCNEEILMATLCAWQT